MKKYLFNLLFAAFVVVLVKLALSVSEELSTLLTCLAVVIVVAMMRLRA